MSIKILSKFTVNKIAAGEIIERPSSVVKELLENSVDAGATKIEIIVEQAGKNLIFIRDNGPGMSQEDLELAIQRYATSKLDEEDLQNINSLGFRGEALPSIGAISRLKITSKYKSANIAYNISIIGGVSKKMIQASLGQGTVVEVRDLFFATPARLKFLRTDKTELAAIIIICKKIALSYPHIDFTLIHENKDIIKVRQREKDYNKVLKIRIMEIIGEKFLENAAYVNFQQNNIELHGYTSIPTYNKSSTESQFLFINNRPVKDKILNMSLKAAYQDSLSKGRYSVTVLFLKLDAQLVDVNVHPSKTEVRFRDPCLIRSIVIKGIQEALKFNSKRVCSIMPKSGIRHITNKTTPTTPLKKYYINNTDFYTSSQYNNNNNHSIRRSSKQLSQYTFGYDEYMCARVASIENFESEDILKHKQNYYLGMAKAQLYNKYIISQSNSSVIITDQYLSYKRLGYKKIKEQIKKKGVTSQRLFVPEIVELFSKKKTEALEENKNVFFDLGLSIEKLTDTSIIVLETPSLLKDISSVKLINSLSDHLINFGKNIILIDLIEHVIKTYSYYYALRNTRVLSILEMNKLLRQIENINFPNQYNYGRPAYVKLKLKDIEKLFGLR